jgi:hypothetical protein
MNEVMKSTQSDVDPASRDSSDSQTGGCGDLQAIALTLEMQSSAALFTVLATVARLNCRITHLDATERHAALGVLAPRRVAHRVLPCLGQVIEVLAVREAPATVSAPVDCVGAIP